ncbi:hypothetical protein Vadar_033946 [Vaccinium darrowii]|uniref:Uncharacterized protein n=1 Tax=Vaccinium darrowii TaxID=229202 RepID=A0ACB7YTR5_9ERIC|nr:hypothetical protein Vadar_033946 [Vaccinium darrowii]
MSSTLLEVTGASHEEVERLERIIVKDLQKESASSKDAIREYHRRHPAAHVVDGNEEHKELLKEEPWIEFTGEEFHGSFSVAFALLTSVYYISRKLWGHLDMDVLYNKYINS